MANKESDLENAVAAGLALWEASNRKITREQLYIMLAICGRESAWNPNAVQNGGEGNPAYIGWGLWQITPGDAGLLVPLENAKAAWALMNRTPSNPYEPWNLQPDGTALIYPTGTDPNGETVYEYPPSTYNYLVGWDAASIILQKVSEVMFYKYNGKVYWFVSAGENSYWRELPEAAAAEIPVALLFEGNGALLNLWKIGSGQ